MHKPRRRDAWPLSPPHEFGRPALVSRLAPPDCRPPCQRHVSPSQGGVHPSHQRPRHGPACPNKPAPETQKAQPVKAGLLCVQNSGSPTWTRTRDLPINRTGLRQADGHQVEETQRLFQSLLPYPSGTDLIPRHYSCCSGIAGKKLMQVKGLRLPNAEPGPRGPPCGLMTTPLRSLLMIFGSKN